MWRHNKFGISYVKIAMTGYSVYSFGVTLTCGVHVRLKKDKMHKHKEKIAQHNVVKVLWNYLHLDFLFQNFQKLTD